MSRLSLGFDLSDAAPNHFDGWGLLEVPHENGVIEGLVTGVEACRELLAGGIVGDLRYGHCNRQLKRALRGKNGWSYLLTSSTSTNKKYDQNLKESIKLLNFFESKVRWKKSKLALGPLHDNIFSGLSKHKLRVWVFQINSKWLNGSCMLSMVILILRAGAKYDIKTLERCALGIDDPHKILSRRRSSLSFHVRDTIQYWLVILKNYNKLFPTTRPSWLFERWVDTESNCGVSALVNSDTCYPAANEIMCELLDASQK